MGTPRSKLIEERHPSQPLAQISWPENRGGGLVWETGQLEVSARHFGGTVTTKCRRKSHGIAAFGHSQTQTQAHLLHRNAGLVVLNRATRVRPYPSNQFWEVGSSKPQERITGSLRKGSSL